MARIHKLSPRHLRGWKFTRPGTWLVRFGAPWCPWCRTIEPALQRLAQRPDLQVGTIQVDEDEELVDRHQLFTLPTLILFRDGREMLRRVGPLSADALEAWVSTVLATHPDVEVARAG